MDPPLKRTLELCNASLDQATLKMGIKAETISHALQTRYHPGSGRIHIICTIQNSLHPDKV